MGELIAILSGKGGIGKTAVCAAAACKRITKRIRGEFIPVKVE